MREPKKIQSLFRDGGEQFAYFAGLIGGYAIATRAPLTACTDGPALFAVDEHAGTRSAAVSRSVANDTETLNAAVRGLLDARPFWEPFAGLRDVPLGTFAGE